MKTIIASVVWTALLLFLFSAPVFSSEAPPLSSGQKVYVPAYSHIYVGNREHPSLLTVTLAIRNVDLHQSLIVSRVDYYDTKGSLIRNYLASPVRLAPMGTTRYVVSKSDRKGGSGANFVVEWHSDKPINQPIVETVMIGQQGISFTSRGQVVVTGK